jgi:hypothetical protein
MTRLGKLSVAAGIAIVVYAAWAIRARRSFPGETTPEGAYARIVLAVTQGHPRDCFPYLETQAQWASYSIRDYRAKSAALVARAYPEPERTTLLLAYRPAAEASDGADVWLAMAESRGWIGRLRKDLSGIHRVEVSGERASVETTRGTRYAFRVRENGIWGLTLFTAELVAEAEKAARDYDLVKRAAEDYERAAAAASAP